MKSKIIKNLRRVRHPATDSPIRGELMSLEQLENLAAELAVAHKVSPKKSGRNLLARLEENHARLLADYRTMTAAAEIGEPLTPAAEWLVDNFHIVEEQLREVREDLPRGFYRELPKLESGEFAGFPRVYLLASKMIAHTDHKIEPAVLDAFIEAYQKNAALKMGELWAFPISLRLGLIENLRRFAEETVKARADRAAGDEFAERLISEKADEFSTDALKVVSTIFDNETGVKEFSPTFIARLAARLREGNRVMLFVLEKIESLLRREGKTIERLTHLEYNRQAAAQVSVGNIITSMRLVSTLDWSEFFEKNSLVDRALRQDPARVYEAMDFTTRDSYRHAVERIAKITGASEIEIAEKVLEFARQKKNESVENENQKLRKSHVGYFLDTDKGLRKLEQFFGYQPGIRESADRFLRRHPIPFYLTAIFSLTAFFAGAVTYAETVSAGFPVWVLLFILLLAATPAGDLAITIVNWTVTMLLKPRRLAKMDFTKKAIPDSARTFVVIPTLLTDEAAIKELYEKLEIYYLANREPQIYFALLGDLKDAQNETEPGDEDLRRTGRNCCAELNEKYFSEDNAEPKFYFFSRRRRRNAGENAFICRERKRGNLHEFNRLLRGAADTSFDLNEKPDFDFLKTIRYVITLDVDTQLPRDAARRLIGTIEHPLNRPVFDAAQGRVTEGYGILQPRIEINLPSAARSPFAGIFSAAKGFDPYTTAVSDVYQDLFDEGNYVGKGLYDVDAFEAALDRRIPENKLLSHDLFEGLYARVALVSDTVFYDDYPSSFYSFSQRAHRWTRGDWQIMRWLLPLVPDAEGRMVKNRLPLLARWKILENLRRSLVAASILIWLVFAWTILPLSPLVSTLFAFIALTAPLYLQIAAAPTADSAVGIRQSVKLQFINLLHDLKTSAIQISLRFTFLVHEAVTMSDAILRVFYRKFVSKKYLLEWVTAAESDKSNRKGWTDYYRLMLASPVFAVSICLGLAFFYPQNLIYAAPFLVLWFFAPLIAFYLSRITIKKAKIAELRENEIEWMRKLARRTWRFFEAFVGEKDHWLPPDNFQQEPFPLTAHRTSPTNIGLFLVSTLAARDFGYLGTLETIERLELTFTTLERLPRFRGHFYNWYSTETLEPLAPPYISTVDSGNLAGCLIALAEGCLELVENPLFGEQTKRGLLDTLAFVKSEAEELKQIQKSDLRELLTEIEAAEKILQSSEPKSSANWKSLIETLSERTAKMSALRENFTSRAEPHFAETEFWLASFENLVRNLRRDQDFLAADEKDFKAVLRTKEMRENFRLRAESLAAFCRRLVEEMDFKFLYDDERKVLTIGYRPAEGEHDRSFYDLLASEARLASFIAIVKGDVEEQHWFRLGRRLVGANGTRALVSWSGTMFEYLMPLLLMRDYENTLLSETCKAIVRRQIKYGSENNVAWGISESAYNARDLQLNYQYGAFGVPGLGLKRGLAEDLVVSPYASALALTIAPSAAMANLLRLSREGMLGQFGFFEAVDYTKERLPPNEKFAVIESYMAHHQGMIFVALDNLLNDDAMVRRFHRAPVVETGALLLQERIPRLRSEAEKPRAAYVASGRRASALAAPALRHYTTAEQSAPPVCLLSNGYYTVMLTTAGGGYSRAGNRAVTRWREDAVLDNFGQYIYLRDLRSGAVWSSGFQPVSREPQQYEVVFTESKAQFRRRDAGILTETEIIVASEDNAELRRLTLTNETERTREIEITSYGEIVLTEQAADEAHPAFSNLFIETFYDEKQQTIFARRCPRSNEEAEFWMAHGVAVAGKISGEIGFETDRAKFIGRGRTAQNPSAIASETNLSGTSGEPLDPIFSLRAVVSVKPNESASLIFTTAVAPRERLLELADKYRQENAFERAEKLAWTRSQVALRHFGVSTDEANLFQRLAGCLIYINRNMRPHEEVLKLNRGTPQTLWKYGISGDLPIMIARVGAGSKDFERSVSQILRAHEYLRQKGLAFDLVFFNDQPTSYAPGIREDLLDLIRRSAAHTLIDQRGGVFIRRSDEMPEEDRIALHAAARVCFVTERGTLEEQLAQRTEEKALPPNFIPRESSHLSSEKFSEPKKRLEFQNNYGGFSEDGKEYVINLNDDNSITPMPWSNVVANSEGFGFIATESGTGMVWSLNSRENRLTPWTNDPVANLPSECIFLRDEATGSFWTPTPLPARGNAEYAIRYGAGYAVYETASHGLGQELLVFAANDASVKISRLRVTNLTRRRRELSAAFYCDLVLGVERAKSAPFIVTEIDAVTGAIFARNPYNAEFSDRVAFVAVNSEDKTWSCDRREFLGRNGSWARPAAMFREKLSGAVGAGFDPCASIQTKFELAPNETREIVFLLGEEKSEEKARIAVSHFRQKSSLENEFAKVVGHWNEILDAIQVKTPDKKLDLLVNRWLVYQTLSCRFWARSSVYQSGGAFGFRDQLQDVMSFVYARPDLAREHILRAASRQFKEGDVQHWWHEPSGAGTRTRISDNLLWLVFVVCFYVEKTGDAGIFDEEVRFLDAPPLAESEQEVYLRPVVSNETASVFEHCRRAVEKSLATGERGLPLIGAGDWSDGLNRVGEKGRGESVWLGWFLGKILNDFAEVCQRRKETKLAEKYRRHAESLRENLEANAWDGEWYVRAFFDDGTPLGASANVECRIDSLPQSWSVISGLGNLERAERSFKAVEKYLIKRDEKLALLLTPPFDKTELEPGYIKGYPPGIRENGGQYTHAAAWLVIAYTLMKNGEKAYDLFSMINPLAHALSDAGEIEKYKTEPYAVAADVYSHPQHSGRGGWTWYTGSAGWLYRAALEYILGFQKIGDSLKINPCIPRDWRGYEIKYRYRETLYRISVENPQGAGRKAVQIMLDGENLDGSAIPLVNDQKEHFVQIILGAAQGKNDEKIQIA